ncbi:DUF695 domain-containing protein [Pseudomonadota bacterium]
MYIKWGVILFIILAGCAKLEAKESEEMQGIWYTFPASMGEDQAWVTYSHGYAEIAKGDIRNNHLRIRAQIKKPTEYGMPTNEEFPNLSALDDMLDDGISKIGGIYTGRITVSGSRYFYYYTDATEDNVKHIIEHASDSTGYELQYMWEHDPEKNKYWEELYPTADDWQVIQDLKVLDSLAEEDDLKDKEREVQHWAYFSTNHSSEIFKNWVSENSYTLIYMPWR